MARLPLEQLEAFVCAARLGNLTRAAESMNLTVSALSYRMRLLEERVGQVLLRRGPRGVVPTVAGQRLLDEVGEPLDRIAQALRRCSAVPGNAVTLSLTPSLANAWLVPRLPQLVAAHPQLGLSLQSSVELVDFEREPVDLWRCAWAVAAGRACTPSSCSTNGFRRWPARSSSPAMARCHWRDCPNCRSSATRAGAGRSGSNALAGRRRRTTSPISTTARRCTRPRPAAWAWVWHG